MLSSGRQRGFQQYVSLCCPAYPGEDACVTSQPGQPGVEPGTARCGPAIEEVMRWQGRQAPGRQPPDVRGSAAPGNPLVAPPKSRRVRLLLGWPGSQSARPPPVVVS